MVQSFRPKNIPAPSPKRPAWVGWVLFRALCKSRVDFSFVPIQARADFHGLGQAPEFHVAVDGRAATPAQFGLKVCEREKAHFKHSVAWVRFPVWNHMRTGGLWYADECQNCQINAYARMASFVRTG